MAHRVDSLRCEGSDAVGAKRTCRERRKRVDLTKMTPNRHGPAYFAVPHNTALAQRYARVWSSTGGLIYEATRVRHAAWHRGGVAGGGARAAAGSGAADRGADGLCRERLGSTGQYRRIPGRTPEARVDGWPQHPDRHSLGDTHRRGVDATI